MDRALIIKAIDDYAAASGLRQSTICQYAVRNRHAYDRLVSGSLRMSTAEEILRWIADNPPAQVAPAGITRQAGNNDGMETHTGGAE